MGNALLWCVERETEAASTSLFNTGELVGVSGESVTWTTSNGRELKRRRQPLSSDILEMDRIGMWETSDGTHGVSYILSASESDIPVNLLREAEGDYFNTAGAGPGNLKLWLLAALFSLLLLESWLFHRLALY